MEKDFVKKGILLPLIIAAVLCAAFFAVTNANAQRLIPVPGGITVAYHGTDENPEVGTVNGLFLLNTADYGKLGDGALLMPPSSEIDAAGCLYIRVTREQLPQISGNTLTVTIGEQTHRYQFAEEKTLSYENRVFAVSPRAVRSAVVYYPVTDGAGLTSQYTALVYEEAM